MIEQRILCRSICAESPQLATIWFCLG